ncbi:MAG: hypothetical protein HOG95_16025 [Rhodospirillaceae bacterium]|jgi:hypothetical protein|nr:hypothetical protein [Rhodospirillaceae bacterium]MBT5941439.1 hypothetical protein [Rhodospirillaceae bacterium]MBT7266826.1 hypothetical protein [Rhodospirillaceae bacterium]
MADVQMTPEERKKSWLEISVIDEAQFDAMREEQAARQVKVPQPGDDAPDFEIDVLDPDRQRTGETVKLSNLRGKPVALMFGSYT